MNLSLQATAIAVILALLFLAVVVELIRRHKLQERYSVLWAVTAGVMLLGVLIPGVVPFLASALGIRDTSIALLSLLILLLLALALNLTVVASRQAEQNTHLAQEIAILRAEQQELPAPPASATPSSPHVDSPLNPDAT